MSGIWVVCIGVEMSACPLHAAQEVDRRNRGPRLEAGVVAPWSGHAAADLLAREPGQMDAVPDRVAHLRVDLWAPGTERMLARADELGLQEDRIVRLVPGEPVPDRRQRQLIRRRPETPAVSLSRGVGEVPQIDHPGRSAIQARARPARRPENREDDLDPALRRALDHGVVQRPVVRRVSGIDSVRGPSAPRDARRAAPVEVDANRLHAERVVLRERPVRVPERLGLVEDADDQPARRLGRRGDEQAERREHGCDGRSTTHGRPRRSATCGAGRLRARSPAPTQGAALLV